MPIFVILGNLTEKGIKNLKDAAKRHELANKVAESVGGKVLKLYYTMGRYDWVAIAEGPSVESAMKALFMYGMEGSNRTETLVALTDKEALKIIEELP